MHQVKDFYLEDQGSGSRSCLVGGAYRRSFRLSVIPLFCFV